MLTQEELAIRAKISPRTLQRLERGGTALRHTVVSLANALEVDVSQILSNENYSESGDEAAKENSDEGKLVRVNIVLKGRFDDLSEDEQVAFVEGLKKFLSMDRDIRIVRN